jgi:endonuclease/exonuclease/phosphatase family metal-dependent hydrolase
LRAAFNVNGTVVQVFALHLQTGGCENDAQSRYNSLAMFKTWASGNSVPQIVGGDYNATPDQIDTTQGMLPNFVDTWSVVGSGQGLTWPSVGALTAPFVHAGVTSPVPIYKIDYLFTDSSETAQPISTEVVTSASGAVSDHYPVFTMFRIQ